MPRPGLYIGQEEALHFALDTLEKTGDDAKSAIETVKQLKATKPKSEYVKRIVGHLVEKFK